MTSSSPSGDSRPSNLNLPNVLTSLRIIFVPVFAWMVLKAPECVCWQWAAFAMFVALMITDKLDGDIARKRNLVTDFGKIADPIADKALVSAALICLNVVGWLPVAYTVAILVREFGITIWRMFMLRRGLVVPASKGGKLKTTLQAVAIGMYLCPLPAWMDLPTHGLMIAAVVVTVVTGFQYLWDSRKQ
ncbi:CDP-diacylglycerol--glycerol-3-phosphate 3-phosphatidyltransferase [Corynebacterium uterequi]|uniref:CDP-diacylglycerol--glycerol-3-phosphate 3-phosphatidyltransferase n=1 Tax=Corynebacterium uterequi TaxID=1072256 RepID=A0A0G3HHA3_9CORY|nr:CDP-diacylglycerol--glycerol-3-phosphate 3-phosphatidyltransferase [Corynebacterium uterequi]AKK11308.1 CDP-diacylglycerol--glycerol-3-phosphate 3-phosphatidyltransferase [Corynebacterium uterequi]